MLDVYPIPRIEELIPTISRYEIFNTIDLRSAYHQFPMNDSEKHFTDFEADGKLYNFLCIPLGSLIALHASRDLLSRSFKMKN